MTQKNCAKNRRYSEHYWRPRRPDVKYRPVKQPGVPKGIDSRTMTRYATTEEQELARQGLRDLEEFRNQIMLVPAPEKNFDSHKIRVVASRNPDWYVGFGKRYWNGPRRFGLKRSRVERALKRVVSGKIRGNGYEKDLLECLRKRSRILA
jgi:hypothetical protein